MFGGKALGWMAGTLIWMPGALRASVSSYSAVTASPLLKWPLPSQPPTSWECCDIPTFAAGTAFRGGHEVPTGSLRVCVSAPRKVFLCFIVVPPFSPLFVPVLGTPEKAGVV